MRPNTVRTAFTLTDLLGLLAGLAVAASLLLAATRQIRQEARTASSLSQLRWMAGATSSYAADNAGQFWSFSWAEGPTPSAYPDLQFAGSALEAHQMQGTDIMRRLSGRDELPRLSNWLPHALFNHLPLVDYLRRGLPDFNLVAPGDAHRLNWARDPAGFDAGRFLPFQPEPTDVGKRWVYSASYLTPPAWWDPHDSIVQATHRSYFFASGTEFSGADLADVAFPSQKVMAHDQEQRGFGSRPLYGLDGPARAAVLMADGSAAVRAAADANYGWHPARRTAAFPSGTMRYIYDPFPWEAATSTGDPRIIVTGRYRFTRGGIAGRDFGGPEIDTGQP